MMNIFMKGLGLTPILLALNGCAGGGHGPGYGFHFIFIIIPLIVIGYFILKRGESIGNSLDEIEAQIRKLSGKIDNVEEKIKKYQNKEGK